MMQVVLLDDVRFDEYAVNHPNYSFYQSSNYGKFMSKHGYNSYYLGLVNEMNEIKAATLMIDKNDQENKRKMGYCPRGFLIDWNDEFLVNEFTNKLKDFLSKRNFTYLKVDPKIVYKEHELDGLEKINGENNLEFVKKLQKLGYIHMGYNNGMEASKPRWDSLMVLDNNITNLFNTLPKDARSKIKEAADSGCRVYKGTSNDVNILYDTIGKQVPPAEYYLDFYEFFGQNNGFEIYFTKLEPVNFVNSSKKAFEMEEQRNNELNMLMQDWNNPNKANIINEKLKSDEILAKHKKNMVEAIQLFQKYPNGLVTAACAVVKYGKTVTFFANGVKEEYKSTYPEYLLHWQLIEYFAKQGYEVTEFNGIIGEFSEEQNNTIRREISNKIVEYVGEFDLVINKKAYYTGSKVNPIISWLNTPI